jgi:alpha-glucoside transport system substrate-binding protein
MQLRGSAAVRGLTLLAAASIAFAACSSSSSTPAPTTAPTSAATGAPGSAAASSGTGQIGGSVSVIGTWTGDEQKNFLAMVAPFEQATGVKVNYTGTRDINAVLTTGVASGVLPDLAGLPGPGQMAQYAQAGKLIDLSTVLDVNKYTAETAPALVALGTVDSKIVGVFIKTAVKGLIWFDPKVNDFSANPPKTWTDLTAAITANASKADKGWCLGVESGAASGWPGTDWIEDFVLREDGADVYNQWWQGKVKWTDPQIKKAFTDFGDVIANSYGGSNTILATNFANAGDPLFKTPPGCLFLHQASFITGLGAFAKLKAGTDYNFFPFPDVNPANSGALEGAGDLFGMFHDTPQAKALMQWLVTAPAQQIWVTAGGAISANKLVTNYPDDIAKRSADLLANAKSFVFDASDLMPSAMSSAFQTAIVDYIKDPTKLDSILANLDTVAKDAYATQ